MQNTALGGLCRTQGGVFSADHCAGGSAQNIARRAGCDTTGTAGAELDLMTTLDGTETTTLAFDTGCTAGADAALWTLRGAPHIPVINPAGTRAALTWLLRHDRTP